MIIIKSTFIIRECGAIEPCLFVAYYLTMFPIALSCVYPTVERHIFIHNTYSIRIIRRKEIWIIRRGGQSTNVIFRGNRDVIWEQIWSILGSFILAGSIINGD